MDKTAYELYENIVKREFIMNYSSPIFKYSDIKHFNIKLKNTCYIVLKSGIIAVEYDSRGYIKQLKLKTSIIRYNYENIKVVSLIEIQNILPVLYKKYPKKTIDKFLILSEQISTKVLDIPENNLRKINFKLENIALYGGSKEVFLKTINCFF